MQQEKRRPTLEELRDMPAQLWQLEVAQIAVDASIVEQFDIMEEAELLMVDPDLTPDKVVELRERLRCATGSTGEEAAAPVPRPDAA